MNCILFSLSDWFGLWSSAVATAGFVTGRPGTSDVSGTHWPVNILYILRQTNKNITNYDASGTPFLPL